MDSFLFEVSSNLLQQKCATEKIIGMIVPRKYKPKISAVGLFCCDKFQETSNKKVSDLSKLTKPYFKCKNDVKSFYNR